MILRKINSIIITLTHASLIIPILLSLLQIFSVKINNDILVSITLILIICSLDIYSVNRYYYKKEILPIIFCSLLLAIGFDLNGLKFIPSLLIEIPLSFSNTGDILVGLFFNTPSLLINTSLNEFYFVNVTINLFMIIHIILLLVEYNSISLRSSAAQRTDGSEEAPASSGY